jgi:hypothetical protein
MASLPTTRLLNLRILEQLLLLQTLTLKVRPRVAWDGDLRVVFGERILVYRPLFGVNLCLENKIENGVLGKKGTIDAYLVVDWEKMNSDDRLGMAGVWNPFSVPLCWQVLVGSGMISLTTKSRFGDITRLGFYSLGKGEFSIFHMGNKGSGFCCSVSMAFTAKVCTVWGNLMCFFFT